MRRSLIPLGGEVIVSEPKTARGRRSIALDPETVEVLKAQAARQLAEQQQFGESLDSTQGYLCTKEDGQPYHPEVVSRCFRQAVKKAMLPMIRPHDLRHTHATLALQAGIHPKVVSERLGHASISITLDTYSHAIPAHAGGGGGADRGAGVRRELSRPGRLRPGPQRCVWRLAAVPSLGFVERRSTFKQYVREAAT